MTAEVSLIERRPFDETIVEAMRRCSVLSSREILNLFRLIKDTKIRVNGKNGGLILMYTGSVTS